MALFNPLMVGVEGIGTPEELDRLRAELAARQPQYGKASNIGEGIGQLLTGIGSGIQNYRLGKAKKAGDASAASARDTIYSGLTGGVNSSFASPSQPSASQAPSVPQKPMAISGGRQDFVSALLPAAMEESKRTGVDPRIIIAQGALESGWGKSAPGNNLFGIKSHGQSGGNTLATTEYVNGKPVTIRDSFRAYENPAQSVRGYGDFILQNPRYKPLREAQGLDAQISALQASGYATDPKYGEKIGAIARGIQLPGETSSADPQQAFSAVLGQQQNVPHGAAGATIGDKMLTYDDKGARMEPSSYTVPKPANPYSGPGSQINAPMPVYDDKGMRMEPSLSYGRQPTQPQQVAQAAPQDRGMMEAIGGGQGQGANYFPPAPGQQKAGGIDLPTLMKAAQNPWLDSGTRQLVNSLIQQEMQKQSPEYQMQQQKQQLEMQKSQLELDNLRNPKPEYDIISGKDGSIFRADKKTGKIEQVYGGKPDLPTDVQEYEYAKQQGFQGTFVDFQLAQKRAGASSVNIDQRAEGAFDKKLAEKQAEAFDTMATDGMNARADVAVIDELSTLMAGRGGTFDGISGSLAKYGIGGDGVGDIQAAQALINKLVPSQRQPGSGSMSDRDVELFTRSLPSLWNQPGGNQRIINTMRGLAQYKQMQGDIAQRVMTGEIDRQTATKMLRDLPNPLEGFRQKDDGATKSQDQAAPAGAPSLDDLLKKYGD